MSCFEEIGRFTRHFPERWLKLYELGRGHAPCHPAYLVQQNADLRLAERTQPTPRDDLKRRGRLEEQSLTVLHGEVDQGLAI